MRRFGFVVLVLVVGCSDPPVPPAAPPAVPGETLLEVEAIGGGLSVFCPSAGTLLWVKVQWLETADGLTGEALLTGAVAVKDQGGRSCISGSGDNCIVEVELVPVELSVEEVSELQALLDAVTDIPPPTFSTCEPCVITVYRFGEVEIFALPLLCGRTSISEQLLAIDAFLKARVALPD